MRKIFPVCCASAETLSAKSMAQAQKELTKDLFFSHVFFLAFRLTLIAADFLLHLITLSPARAAPAESSGRSASPS